jgi:DNA-binding Lrp family transcriptional regulator
MDAIDAQIVDMLRANARLPLKTIAAAVNLARSSVRDRISRLEEAGVIRGYHAKVVSGVELAAVLQLKLARTPDPVVVAAVVGAPEVRRCYSLTGEVDLLVEIAAPDTERLNAVRDRIAGLPDVVEVTTAFVLKRDKDI